MALKVEIKMLSKQERCHSFTNKLTRKEDHSFWNGGSTKEYDVAADYTLPNSAT